MLHDLRDPLMADPEDLASVPRREPVLHQSHRKLPGLVGDLVLEPLDETSLRDEIGDRVTQLLPQPDLLLEVGVVNAVDLEIGRDRFAGMGLRGCQIAAVRADVRLLDLGDPVRALPRVRDSIACHRGAPAASQPCLPPGISEQGAMPFRGMARLAAGCSRGCRPGCPTRVDREDHRTASGEPPLLMRSLLVHDGRAGIERPHPCDDLARRHHETVHSLDGLCQSARQSVEQQTMTRRGGPLRAVHLGPAAAGTGAAIGAVSENPPPRRLP